MSKRKIFNDPVYGFISVQDDFLFKIIEHPYFQRLRRIKQLGLTHLVYPGAFHTRFHHAMGAMHLMSEAIEVLRSKGNDITDEEARAVLIAILLHDIGHGPFSHALENCIVYDLSHEYLSKLFMERLNIEFKGKLQLAIDIFRNKYKKKFLHQLVSGQLDVDRLDYLKRDSFFTGVSEGVISTERIIKMMDVVNDQLVIEAKGIYSIEKFIIARRLMYWQVYLHKTVLGAEYLLIKVLNRAKYLADNGVELFATPSLHEFLYNKYNKEDFLKQPILLNTFSNLDDYDIYASVKVWRDEKDPILSTLSKNIMERRLFHVDIQNQPFDKDFIEKLKKKVSAAYKIKDEDVSYFVFSDKVENNAYNQQPLPIPHPFTLLLPQYPHSTCPSGDRFSSSRRCFHFGKNLSM
ncbi:MAG: HD domain-containing protein [Bacteroidetes bacterium]|nr:HD domain-containing protein [Bacteroidota bacterium]